MSQTDLRSRLLARIESKPDEVWTPGDFADLGAGAAWTRPCSDWLRLTNYGGLTEAFMTGRARTT
ncbi:hypothetical protein [Mesorhizobium sp. M0435]|uniref:hypothetical protein n=1 Tax=Mesorhizobium sp. M0435 TaxID=2956944 RepID=UPI0033358C6B